MHSDQRYEALKQINALARYFTLAENKTDKLIQVLNKLPKNTLELIKKQHIQNDEALTGYDINSDIDEYLSYIIYKNIILNFDSYISVKSRPKSDKIKISDLQIYGKKFVKSVEDIIKYPDGFMTSVMFKFEDFDSSQVNFILSADLKAELQQRNSELLTIRKLVLSKFIFLMLNTLIEINLNQQVLNSCVELVKLRKHLSDCLDSSDWKKIMEIVQTASLNRLKNV